MAKKTQNLQPLTFAEIVLRGDAETLREALEARTKIDDILVEREAAYQRIAELESQVETIVGEDGLFPFPEPPAEVASFGPAKKKPAKKAEPKVVDQGTVEDETAADAEATDEEKEEATEE